MDAQGIPIEAGDWSTLKGKIPGINDHMFDAHEVSPKTAAFGEKPSPTWVSSPLERFTVNRQLNASPSDGPKLTGTVRSELQVVSLIAMT